MLKNFESRNIRCEVSPRALEKWNPAIKAAVENTGDTITIYGVIGESYWDEGVTVKRIDAALRAVGDKPVTVYINSPGGDMFEGIAIYNRLREHTQKVTTKVLGIAASAASVIYLAGSERQVATSSFLMIHNCWTYAAGNRHAFRDYANDMEEFDGAMADLYAETSGQPVEDMAALMDDETFIRGKRAIELGLATGLLASDEVVERDDEDSTQANAAKRLDTLLAKAGVPRAERRKLFSDFKSGTLSAAGADTPSAIGTGMPGAVHLAEGADAQTSISASLVGIFPVRLC